MSVAALASRLQEVQIRFASVEHALAIAYAEVQCLTCVLAEAQAQVSAGQDKSLACKHNRG